MIKKKYDKKSQLPYVLPYIPIYKVLYVFAPLWKPYHIDLKIWHLLVRQPQPKGKEQPYTVGLKNQGIVHYAAVQVDL